MVGKCHCDQQQKIKPFAQFNAKQLSPHLDKGPIQNGGQQRLELLQMPQIIHGLVQNPHHLHKVYLLAVKNDIHPARSRKTSREKFFSRTTKWTIRLAANDVQCCLYQTVVTFKLPFPPSLNRLLKNLFNILFCRNRKLAGRRFIPPFARPARFVECSRNFFH